jgi:cyclopropane-fatty-acyl-phospholipid synthase
MRLVPAAIEAIERFPVPDRAIRAGISALVGRTRRKLAAPDPSAEREFASRLARLPIAEHTAAANDQHYEVPADFFGLCLGPRRKYSCCFYEHADTSLAEAETAALALTAAHADLEDGQAILELGCGWGSLTLWLAEHLPHARITAVSNSQGQRLHIEGEARRRGLDNIAIVTADMNAYAPSRRYDRIVSVEMFEHMANWRALLERTRAWLEPDGRLFLHVFTHAGAPYRFDHQDPADWIAQHFFTGGLMPSRGLIRQFPDLYDVVDQWDWNGRHYARTARDWLARFDAQREAVEAILTPIYGDATRLWMRRWRLFFLATEGLFGHDGGQSWGVSHYLLRSVAA